MEISLVVAAGRWDCDWANGDLLARAKPADCYCSLPTATVMKQPPDTCEEPATAANSRSTLPMLVGTALVFGGFVHILAPTVLLGLTRRAYSTVLDVDFDPRSGRQPACERSDWWLLGNTCCTTTGSARRPNNSVRLAALLTKNPSKTVI